MSEQSTAVLNMLCAALEIEAKEKEFYSKAADECPNAFGREIFGMLVDDEEDHAKHIGDIYKSLKKGRDWPESCALFDKETRSARNTIATVAQKHDAEIKEGVTAPDALEVGVELELASVKFYEDHLKNAEDPFEKKFLEKMVQEERAHHRLLTDMQYYYADPGGYFMEKEHRVLDGA